MKIEIPLLNFVLYGVAALALLAGQAEATPQVSDTLIEEDNYETVFPPLLSNSDLADASNGGTTSYTGSGLGTCHACMIDGTLFLAGDTGNALLPNTGGVLEIFLDTSVNTLGYDITSVVPFTGWNSASRADQQYVLAMRSVGGSYGDIITVDIDMTPHGSGNGEEGMRVTIDDDGGGLLGTGIDALRFTMADPLLNGVDAYQEIDVFGTPTPEPSSVTVAVMGMIGLLGLLRRRR
jgi:uncharacterized protein (TIGR03382 family)